MEDIWFLNAYDFKKIFYFLKHIYFQTSDTCVCVCVRVKYNHRATLSDTVLFLL